MPTVKNTKIIYKAIPKGLPEIKRDFDISHDTIDTDTVALPNEGLLLRTLFISADPYMRGRMRDPKIPSYSPAFTMGEPMNGGVVAEVIRSESPRFTVGDIVLGNLPWASYPIVSGKEGPTSPIILPNARTSGIPLSYYLGILGMPGLTAYVGLMEIGKPKAGETLYVSAAAGAVGQVVGQIGKILGLRVVGSAGDDDKVAYLKEIGFDAAFNYKKVSSYEDALREHCPKGIDVYFENVGGKMLDAAIAVANKNARVATCGMISQYNRPDDPEPIYNSLQILVKSLTVRGFVVMDYQTKYEAAFVKDVGGWLKDGKIKYREAITLGINQAPEALIGVLTGANQGKAVIKVADL